LFEELCLNPFASLFDRKPAALIGLDISSSSIKLVELDKRPDGGYTLERCALETLEPGWVIDGTIEKTDEVVQAIERVIKKSGTKAKNVAMALPAAAVITKRIVLPAGLTESEMEIQVETEANQYIPFSLDEVSLDFCTIGPSPSSADDIEVLIAASRKEKVEERQSLAEAVGIKPVILDIDSYAARAVALEQIKRLPNQGKDLIVALFEIGSMSTAMQVMQNGNVLYERDQMFGGAQLTQLIVRQYGFSADEAEQKKRAGDLPEDFGQTVLAPFVEGTAQEVARALQFFYTSTPFNSVDYILLAGGGANLDGLVETVASASSTVCKLIDPFDGMQISSSIKDSHLRQSSSSYIGACGLAMRRFSL
jgi:type IV pilus assembly protein PilM